MSNQIVIKTKQKGIGEYGYKIISVRIKEDLLSEIDNIAAETNRSRNEIINTLIQDAVNRVIVDK